MNDITIRRSREGGWDVIQGDRIADGVSYEEMLGLVSALTMPEPRPCVHWMQTEEQRRVWRVQLQEIGK